MKAGIVIFVILSGITFSYPQSARPQGNCGDQTEFIHPEYQKIISRLKSKGLEIENGEAVFEMYKDRILDYFSNNHELFSKNDTVRIKIKYQSHSMIGFSSITNIDNAFRDKYLKELNDFVFPVRDAFDSSLVYCIGISGNVVRSSNAVSFSKLHYNIGTIKRGGKSGNRTRANVMRKIMGILASMRYAYNVFLRDEPGLKGRITIKFIINQEGMVIYARVVSSTVGNCAMEKKEMDIIVNTNFGKIDSPYDLTEVVYPFIFSQ